MFQEKKKPKEPVDMVKKLQEVSAAEQERERKRKADEEAKKKKGSVTTAPSDGILSRFYKYATGSGDKEKK